MPPPPPQQPTPTAAAPRRAAMLDAVNTLASYSDTLADFLDQWNSVILDVASIAATFAVLIPGPESDPKALPLPAAEPQPPNPTPESERENSPAPDQESQAEPNPAPEPEPEPEPERESVPSPPAPEPEPESVPNLAVPEPEPNAVPVPEPTSSPAPPAPNPHERERKGVDPSAADPEPEPEPEPESVPNLAAPEPELNAVLVPVPELTPSPAPAPAPNLVRERKGGDPSTADLELRCMQMNYRGLRRFLTAHVRGRERWLREVGPAALCLAADPAALVLRTVGRYYIRAESRDAEEACTLLLELYVRAGCPRCQGHLRQEAREGALSWRSRLVRVGSDGASGARGLAFFMAGFGVPAEFPAQELYDLIDAASGAACIEVLKCSKLFVKKMLDVAIEMINKAMYLQAIRIILAFELQHAFPLAATLNLVMEKIEHDRKDESEDQASEHDEEELALLSSIFKCMEDHKLCPSEFSAFAEKIALLEERVGKPTQALAGIKRKRTEDLVEQDAH
ncbi:hypothetical protein U9M48_011197 [Paspalum notatum var. saurae]|uniref:FRIGIDA-like protein n=1 Tax=Paspalum notatum var. saurae TaxID=547442 RepID=A0AAQ3WGX7_PASNO